MTKGRQFQTAKGLTCSASTTKAPITMNMASRINLSHVQRSSSHMRAAQPTTESPISTARPSLSAAPGSETERRLTKLLGHRPKTAGEIRKELDRDGWPNVDTSFMDESPNDRAQAQPLETGRRRSQGAANLPHG